jgi:hypothetical protein
MPSKMLFAIFAMFFMAICSLHAFLIPLNNAGNGNAENAVSAIVGI